MFQAIRMGIGATTSSVLEVKRSQALDRFGSNSSNNFGTASVGARARRYDELVVLWMQGAEAALVA